MDAETFLRVQESGYLVKNPSFVLRKVQFVRKYEIRDGISVPRQMQTVADTWLVGKTELTVDYTNFFDRADARCSRRRHRKPVTILRRTLESA